MSSEEWTPGGTVDTIVGFTASLGAMCLLSNPVTATGAVLAYATTSVVCVAGTAAGERLGRKLGRG